MAATTTSSKNKTVIIPGLTASHFKAGSRIAVPQPPRLLSSSVLASQEDDNAGGWGGRRVLDRQQEPVHRLGLRGGNLLQRGLLTMIFVLSKVPHPQQF